MPELNEVH